ALLAHDGEQFAGGVHHAAYIDREHGIPLLVAAVRQRRAGNDAGAQDEDIDPSVTGQNTVDQLIGVGARGDVVLPVLDAWTDIFMGCDIGGYDLGACSGKGVGDGAAHAAGTARDQGYLAVQAGWSAQDRKSTRLNSSHVKTS